MLLCLLPLPQCNTDVPPCLPQISGDEFFADVVRDILLYVSRDLSDQVGSSLSWAKGSLRLFFPPFLPS